MGVRGARQLALNESAAIAPLYAIGIFTLVGIAGVGFDYARMMSLQSELQNAADQAALAGASQLDGQSGACARAALAVREFTTNNTRVSNDGGGAGTDFGTTTTTCDPTANIVFYADKGKTTVVTGTNDAAARYIEVFVSPRSVTFSLTPLVDMFSSGNMTGVALAGLGSAICKVPPVMMCNPAESTDPDFTISNYVGKGIRLVANVNGKNGAGEDPDEEPGSYGPGVFGYLETDAGNGAINTAKTLGRPTPPGDCVAIDGADVKPGQQVSVLDALNVRFGIYANGLNQVCDNDLGQCPPSANGTIDLVRVVAPGGSGGSCAIGPGGFEPGPRPYRPTSSTASIDPTNIQPMGYPRDKCHAVSLAGSCTGNGNARIGNGDWDRAAYYATNALGTMPSSWSNYDYPELTGRTTPTRYQQYRWEYDNRSTGKMNRRTFTHTYPQGGTTKTDTYEKPGAPFCQAPGIAPTAKPDRRILSVAVINCNAESVGASTTDAEIKKFVDVFLVEPTARRTDGSGTRYTNNSDVYVEVVGATRVGGGATGSEVRRDIPYLIE